MKRALLWICVAALSAFGVLMVLGAVTANQGYPNVDVQILQTADRKLRQIYEQQQRERDWQIYKAELEYVTAAALGFTLAAFLAGRARRARR